jgi:hypothetical protein
MKKIILTMSLLTISLQPLRAMNTDCCIKMIIFSGIAAAVVHNGEQEKARKKNEEGNDAVQPSSILESQRKQTGTRNRRSQNSFKGMISAEERY